MRKTICTIICILVSINIFATTNQDWKKVTCQGLDHEEIYNRILFFVDYVQGDISYDDGHQCKVYFTLPSHNCIEAMHILDFVIYDGYFLYILEQSLQFDSDMQACMSEVREHVSIIENALYAIPSLEKQ